MFELHNLILKEISVNFAADFRDWKREQEEDSNSTFVKQTGSKTDKNQNKITYYYCNRTGFYTSKDIRQRQLKSQGTDKLNAHCTASIKTTIHHITGEVGVETCHTHYGHRQDLSHICLSEYTRLSIAGQLLQGVSQQHILDNVRDKVGEELKRIHLLTKKDIKNIERTYHINNIQRHENDSISVGCWIEEMKKRDDNPVIFYKSQGAEQPETSDNISDSDFVLCLQTSVQARIMRQFGHERIVCIDSTHGTNSYHFSLVTVLVTDEFGEGYPVGWCLSNREDQFVLQHFFNAMKEKIGDITPKWFMSDDAEQFYNAWRAVFGCVDNKLLCTWHVDRAWRDNLTLIKDKQTQVQVYHNLRLLLEKTETNKFEILLTKTTQQLLSNATTSEFGQYFMKYYTPRKEQWAASYRHSSLINTNMYAEAFHHVLKYIYLKGRVNKRVDKCIHTLMKIARDKSFDRLLKLTKGKVTKKMTEINKKHTESTKMETKCVTLLEEGMWDVPSFTTSSHYTVALENNTSCPVNCALKCTVCDECIHRYSCNCQDYVILGNMCKHIHLTIRY